MKLEKMENGMRNFFWGICSKIIMIVLPFFVRTVMIYTLGSQYIGLNSLFISILQVLNLAEIGFGNAIVYSMYKPIVNNDKETICALLNLYKKIYRYLGIIIFVIGIIIMPTIKNMINGTYPSDINIYFLYLVYLINTVCSYFFFAYRTSLLIAHQREDVRSKINIIMNILLYLFQIIILILTKNYQYYILLIPINTILINIFNYLSTIKLYPEYCCIGNVTKSTLIIIKNKIYALFWHKLGNTIIYSFDNIVISTFLGLNYLGIYTNYYYIFNSVASFFSIFYSSIIAGIGSDIASNNKEKSIKNFEILTFINMWMTSFCSICLLCLYQHFMDLWLGESLMLPMSSVILFCIYFFVWQSRRIVHTYKDASGIWEKDRFRPISEALTNLFINIILVKLIGLNGVIISTIISMLFIGQPWETVIFFREYLNISIRKYYTKLFCSLILCLLVSMITYSTCNIVSNVGIKGLVYKAIICVLIPNFILSLVYMKNKEFLYILSTIKKMLFTTSKFNRKFFE